MADHLHAVKLDDARAMMRGAIAPRQPSDFQQQIWLEAQQMPEMVQKQAVALSLPPEIDALRVISALRRLIQSHPELNQRLAFNDEGSLVAVSGAAVEECYSLTSTPHRAAALDLILQRQRQGSDSEAVPPFEAHVFMTAGEVILGLLMHDILAESWSLERLMEALASILAGAGSAARDVADARLARLPVSTLAGHGWLGARMNAESCILRPAEDARFPGPEKMEGLASWQVRLPVASLRQAGLADLSGRALIEAVGAEFSAFLHGFAGVDRIWMALPRDTSPQMAMASRWVDLTGNRQFLLQSPRTRTEALSQLAKEDSAADVPDVVDATVTLAFRQSAERFFAAASLAARALALPALQDGPDFHLSIGSDGAGQGEIELMLTAGRGVSAEAGGFLMDRFLHWLAQEVRSDANADAGQGSHQATTMEDIILAEFREALSSPAMGPEDDFFDHGGHSLIATRIIGRLLSLHGVEIQFNDLFSAPTARGLALRAKRHLSVVADAAPCGTGEETAPLSRAQMSLWKAYSAFGFGDIFNIPFALEFLDPVDETVFHAAFRDVLLRHPGLRSLFSEDGGTVSQKVVPEDRLDDYRWFWTTDQSEGVTRQQEAGYCFDLSRELPVRLRFVKEAGKAHQVLSFLFHHIVLDEWSVNLLMDELKLAYRARAAGNDVVWPNNPAPFQDFARKQLAEGVDPRHLAYWTEMLGDAPRELVLFPAKGDGAAASQPSSPAGGWVEFKLQRQVSEGLYALAKENSASLFNVAYAGISGALHRLGGLTDLVIGTSASGRTDAAYFDTIGYFTTVVAHRLRFSPDMTVGALIDQARSVVNTSMPFTDIPIDLIEEALGMAPGQDHLFEVFIQIHARNKLNGALERSDGAEIAFRQVDPDKHESLLGLQFEVMEEIIDGERMIRVLMSYRADRYGAEAVEKLTRTAQAVFEAFAMPGAASRSLADLPAFL
ncbi:condensation domain-containing protein [Allorhizobium undicola]|uniref:condensation domain-containing protein n=1 Tax=Allorhizobium undicola TaxID=78527 RepID=UPI0006874187|nr:condensation domain-containing protein [Allorhizobium undicola]